MTGYDDRIQSVLKGDYSSESGALNFTGNKSVINKAEDVIAIINRMGIDSSEVAFLSIGGADGTEIEQLLLKTRSSFGILIEFAQKLSDIAKGKAERLQKESGKQLLVYTGDATQNLDTVIQQVEQWKRDDKIKLLVISIHALLHELPDRGSRITDLEGFLQKFLWRSVPIVLIVREPCLPKGLPDIVYLSADCDPRTIVAVAEKIIAKHPSFAGHERPLALNSKVKIDSGLAIETVMKMLYIEQINYEIQERITSYTRDEYLRIFRNVFTDKNITYEDIQTDSFNMLWNKYGFKLYDNNNRELERPQLHIRVIATHQFDKYIDTTRGGTDKKNYRKSF